VRDSRTKRWVLTNAMLTTRCTNCDQFVTSYDDGDSWTHTGTGDIYCDPRHCGEPMSTVTPKLDY
jgi:hypothetical protein